MKGRKTEPSPATARLLAQTMSKKNVAHLKLLIMVGAICDEPETDAK
jgi:hypothetical protein